MTIVSSSAHNAETTDSTQRLPITLSACLRGMRVALHIAYGMLLACVYPLLSKPGKHRMLKNWSLKLLRVLHVGLESGGCNHPADAQGRMFVANHISWLDVIALNAVAPASFVAKSEVRDWPLLGWMCHRAQTLFIKRDTRRDTARINRQIARMLEQGECIALFPEGTSTSSPQPGHFHSSLLQGPIDLNAAIYPVAIRYHDGSGQVCGDAAYVGDMTFIRSLWKILSSPSLHVTLAYLPALSCTNKSRRVLAAEAQAAIYLALNNPPLRTPMRHHIRNSAPLLEVVAGGVYATDNNQERRVSKIENGKVIYESRGGNKKNEWSPGSTLAKPPSIENFAAACSRVISKP